MSLSSGDTARRAAAIAALLLGFAAAPAATRAESDCFPVTQEIRELRNTRAQLRTSLTTAATEAKADLERQLADLDARLAARDAEVGECWYTIHVHAVRVSDSCPGERAAAIDPDQVAAWIAKANEVYAIARVRFEFDPTPGKGDWAELHDDYINNLSVELPGDLVWERGRSAANELATRYPRKLVILFRHGPDATPTGVGFSNTAFGFVAMPGYAVTTICGGEQNAYLLAHEIGHYFGLSHTFRQFKTKSEAAAALRQAGNKASSFDGDGLAETPPEPYIEELQCRDDAMAILNGVPFPLLRNNVMSYYHGAAKTLTPKQSQTVRSWAERRFADAMDGSGSFFPDERRSYQIVSLANGAALEVEKASKENGARIRPAEWNGAASQTWRVRPLTVRDAGSFQIVSVATGKSLTVDGAGTADGARLVQWDWEAKNTQKWRFVQGASGELMIEAKQSGMVLGVVGAAGTRGAGGGSRPGATIEQSTDKGILQQRWKLLPVD